MLKTYLQNLIQLIFAPSRGWEDLEKAEVDRFKAHMAKVREAETANAQPDGENSKRETGAKKETPDYAVLYAEWLQGYTRRMFTCCFIPAITVCALSWFVRLAYDETSLTHGMSDSLLAAFQHTLVSFVGLLLSAVLSQSIFLAVMPRILSAATVEWGAWKGRVLNMVMYSITFLGMVTLISNVVKVKVALLEFLPFYVLFIIWKGCRYVEVPQRTAGLFMILAAACILGLPYLLTFLLNAVTAV